MNEQDLIALAKSYGTHLYYESPDRDKEDFIGAIFILLIHHDIPLEQAKLFHDTIVEQFKEEKRKKDGEKNALLQQGHWKFDIYHEKADSDDEATFVGVACAHSGIEVLQKASQWFEIPDHDLTYKNQRRNA